MLGSHGRVRLSRRILAPIGAKLGVDNEASLYTAPSDPAERVMAALRCGERLIYAYTYAEEWPVLDEYGRGVSKRHAGRASRYIQQALLRPEGRDAISLMAQGYGRAMSESWRTEAAGEADPQRAAALIRGAARGDELAELLASAWPVEGYEALLGEVARAETHRTFDPENPHARADLHGYARRVRVSAEALAAAASARFGEHREAIVNPVRSLHPAHGASILVSWAHTGRYWSNLLAPAPVPDSEITSSALTHGPAPNGLI